MRLLITGAFRPTEAQLKKIENLGYTVVSMPMESGDLPADPAEFEGVICNGLFLHHDISRFSRLRFIQLTSAGLDRVPLDYIREHGIRLYNARGVYSTPMAEWTIMRILEHYKDPAFFAEKQREHAWEKRRELRELAGAEAAIVGAGDVGQEIAKRLQAFGTRVTGYDIHKNATPGFDSLHHITRLADEIGEYDIVILTAPHTPQTYHLLDRSMLERMRKGAMLINVSRGALIDEAALADVLSVRSDLCAALDVFESEPLAAGSPLWDLPNVRISPHNSFVGNGNASRLAQLVITNLGNELK